MKETLINSFLSAPNIYIAQQDIKFYRTHFLGEDEGNMR